MKNKPGIGIIGGAGYTGGELVRLLLAHPQAELNYVHSKSQAGKYIWQVHGDLLGDTSMKFTDQLGSADIIFLCLGHGESLELLRKNPALLNSRLIDLSQDHRLAPDFVYGLPELNKENIAAANHIANPGCFATCIQLSLFPFLMNGLLPFEVNVNATTGSTGAGKSPSETSHFSWRQNNLSVYKSFTHQHLDEIYHSFYCHHPAWKGVINFIPQRGSFPRGILCTSLFDCDQDIKSVKAMYSDFYGKSSFVYISEDPIDLKQVVNTNKCLIHFEMHKHKILVTSVIDNLLKGASGQAVQNMNIMCGFPEHAGLRLKASVY
jgi:N-acetyl-gamma-glutamyl-phosphate reductase